MRAGLAYPVCRGSIECLGIAFLTTAGDYRHGRTHTHENTDDVDMVGTQTTQRKHRDKLSMEFENKAG